MNYADANIIIYAFVDDGEKGGACRALLEFEDLATSVLSLDEIAFKIGKLSKEKAVAAVRLLSNSPNISLVPVLPEDARAFAELLEGGFAPRDAIHALCAKKAGCRKFYSEDKDFKRLKGIKTIVPWQ